MTSGGGLSPLGHLVSDARRPWAWLGVVALFVAIYLALWVAYAANGLRAYGRYVQLPPGASATVFGADYRLLSLTQTTLLSDQNGGDPAVALPNTVWVIAVLEAVRREPDSSFSCAGDILGPQRRVWEPVTGSGVSRDREGSCSDDDVAVGASITYERVVSVPTTFADQVYGVVLPDVGSTRPNQVLRPRLSAGGEVGPAARSDRSLDQRSSGSRVTGST